MWSASCGWLDIMRSKQTPLMQLHEISSLHARTAQDAGDEQADAVFIRQPVVRLAASDIGLLKKIQGTSACLRDSHQGPRAGTFYSWTIKFLLGKVIIENLVSQQALTYPPGFGQSISSKPKIFAPQTCQITTSLQYRL